LKDCRRDLASPDWLMRERGVRILGSGMLESPGVTRLLLQAARDPEGEVRKAAMESLGRLRPTKRRLQVILDALGDGEWEVRWAAVRSLERLRVPTGVVQRALQRALGDPDPSVAEAARLALIALGLRPLHG
jgi:hypothetical protein